MNKETTNRAIITVLGHDRTGIIASIAVCLAEREINILDISQTILQGFFTMTMVVDMSGSPTDMGEIRDRLNEIGRRLELQITVQHEDIFHFMHRI